MRHEFSCAVEATEDVVPEDGLTTLQVYSEHLQPRHFIQNLKALPEESPVSMGSLEGG
jgi:hypothetical protein